VILMRELATPDARNVQDPISTIVHNAVAIVPL